MIRASIKEKPIERRGDKRDFVVITSASGWSRFYNATPELRERKKEPVIITHPHPAFERCSRTEDHSLKWYLK